LPALTDDGSERIDPAESGFEAAALCTVLSGVEQGETNIHSIVIEHQGRLVAELYRAGKDRSIWSFSAHEVQFVPKTRHDMRSVSKSVVGLLFGIVQQRGKVAGVGMPVLDFYPQYRDLRRTDRAAVTLENLLTMSSGLEWHKSVASYGSFGNDETRLYWSWTPYRFVLSRPIVAAPGTRFNYNGGGTAVLADIELSLAVVITAGAYNDPSIGHHVNQLLEDIVRTLTPGSN